MLLEACARFTHISTVGVSQAGWNQKHPRADERRVRLAHATLDHCNDAISYVIFVTQSEIVYSYYFTSL